MKIEFIIQSSSKILNRDEAFHELFEGNLEKEISGDPKILIFLDEELIHEIDYSNLEKVEKLFLQTVDNLKNI